MDEKSAWRHHITPLRRRHFEPLCLKLGLSLAPDNPLAEYGFASAVSGFVRVHFEHDRGLCYLAIGSVSDERSLTSVEKIASRFPRVRAMPGGVQRLSLDEQAQFLTDHWSDLQIMFSPEHVAETKRWKKAAGDAFMKKLRGES